MTLATLQGSAGREGGLCVPARWLRDACGVEGAHGDPRTSGVESASRAGGRVGGSMGRPCTGRLRLLERTRTRSSPSTGVGGALTELEADPHPAASWRRWWTGRAQWGSRCLGASLGPTSHRASMITHGLLLCLPRPYQHESWVGSTQSILICFRY